MNMNEMRKILRVYTWEWIYIYKRYHHHNNNLSECMYTA